MAGVLYHPYFEPSLSWLRSALLVYDKVSSIVPKEAAYAPSDSIKHHLEGLPDTFETLAPEPLDIVHEYFVLNALRQAFKRIAAQTTVPVPKGKRIRYRQGSRSSFQDELEISGITKLHEFKITNSVHQMLEECGLIYGRAGGGFSYVDERAAWLIVSFIAQRMSNRLPVRTITDVDSSFLLSAACNVIETGHPVDSRGFMGSAVLKFHVPEGIGSLSTADFIELRKRYEELRGIFPLYLRDLGELIQIDDVRDVPELVKRVESVVQRIDRDLVRIKRSRIGECIRKWLPVGIGSAVTLGSAFLPDSPCLKYVTGAATVVVQILTEALHNSPIPGRLEGTQSLLLSAKEDIINAAEMASALDIRTML